MGGGAQQRGRHGAPPEIPVEVEWAARSFEAVRGGLSDEEFAQWVRVLDESLAAVGEELAGFVGELRERL